MVSFQFSPTITVLVPGDRLSAGMACQRYADRLPAAKRAEQALRWYRTSLSHFRAGGLHQYVPELLPKIAACRRAISGQPEPPLPEWLEAALIRSKVDMQLAQKIAARCGWDNQPFDLAEFCNHLEKEFGRELALLNLAIEAKHQGIEYKESKNFVGSLICAAFGLDICVAPEKLGRPDDAENACLEAEKAIRNVDDSGLWFKFCWPLRTF